MLAIKIICWLPFGILITALLYDLLRESKEITDTIHRARKNNFGYQPIAKEEDNSISRTPKGGNAAQREEGVMPVEERLIAKIQADACDAAKHYNEGFLDGIEHAENDWRLVKDCLPPMSNEPSFMYETEQVNVVYVVYTFPSIASGTIEENYYIAVDLMRGMQTDHMEWVGATNILNNGNVLSCKVIAWRPLPEIPEWVKEAAND